jgi:hypothetical protein
MREAMKRTMITAALAAALAFANPAIAASPTIPAEYRGEWCKTVGHPYYTPKALLDKADVAEAEDCVKITARRLEGQEEYSCDVASVSRKADGHIIKFNCHSSEGWHNGKPNRERRIEGTTDYFWTSTGTMGRGKRLYIENIDEAIKDNAQ